LDAVSRTGTLAEIAMEVMNPMTYLLPRSAEEYERLRAQARMWEPDTVRLLDAVGLGPGCAALTLAAVRARSCG
jgi:hypothetical protein